MKGKHMIQSILFIVLTMFFANFVQAGGGLSCCQEKQDEEELELKNLANREIVAKIDIPKKRRQQNFLEEEKIEESQSPDYCYTAKAAHQSVGNVALKYATAKCCPGGSDPKVKEAFSNIGKPLFCDYNAVINDNSNPNMEEFIAFAQQKGKTRRHIDSSDISLEAKGYIQHHLIKAVTPTVRLLCDRHKTLSCKMCLPV